MVITFSKSAGANYLFFVHPHFCVGELRRVAGVFKQWVKHLLKVVWDHQVIVWQPGRLSREHQHIEPLRV
jgi:hypothetical protein